MRQPLAENDARRKRSVDENNLFASQLYLLLVEDRYEVMRLLASTKACQIWRSRHLGSVLLFGTQRISPRAYSTSPETSTDQNVKTTRNIGIIAHIDAVSCYQAFRSYIVTHILTGKDDNYGAYAVLQWGYSTNRR